MVYVTYMIVFHCFFIANSPANLTVLFDNLQIGGILLDYPFHTPITYTHAYAKYLSFIFAVSLPSLLTIV